LFHRDGRPASDLSLAKSPPAGISTTIQRRSTCPQFSALAGGAVQFPYPLTAKSPWRGTIVRTRSLGADDPSGTTGSGFHRHVKLGGSPASRESGYCGPRHAQLSQGRLGLGLVAPRIFQEGRAAVSYRLFSGAPGSTAATPSGLMLKARKVKGSLPGFPHW